MRRRDAHAGLVHLGPSEPGRAARLHGRAGGLEVAVVAREPLVAVLPADHPAAAGERVDLAALGGDRVVVAEAAGKGIAAHVAAAWAGVACGTRHEVGSVSHALALVEAGAGTTLLPAHHGALTWDGLVTRPLRQHTPVVETAVCWRPDEDSPVLRRFLRAALSTPEPDVLGPEFRRDPRAQVGR